MSVIPARVVREEFEFLVEFARAVKSPSLLEVVEAARNRCLQREEFREAHHQPEGERLARLREVTLARREHALARQCAAVP